MHGLGVQKAKPYGCGVLTAFALTPVFEAIPGNCVISKACCVWFGFGPPKFPFFFFYFGLLSFKLGLDFSVLSFQYIYQEVNMVADSLANKGHYTDTVFTSYLVSDPSRIFFAWILVRAS